jgi:hypothetical protein
MRLAFYKGCLVTEIGSRGEFLVKRQRKASEWRQPVWEIYIQSDLTKYRYLLEITVLFPPFRWTYCFQSGLEVLNNGSTADKDMIHYDSCVGIPINLGFLYTSPKMRP